MAVSRPRPPAVRDQPAGIADGVSDFPSAKRAISQLERLVAELTKRVLRLEHP